MISVIVPVYNTERYLERCIQSILAQTYSDIELLLVDDGSTDSSGAMCDRYAEQDSRVRVFHKPNGGVSSARNMGLDNAKGEWICFIDSDDEIINFEAFCNTDLESDIILFSLQMYNVRGEVYSDSLLPLVGTLNTKENYIKNYLHFHIFNSVCAKLIRRSIFEDMRFDTSIKFGEDALFNLKLVKLVNKITVCNEIVYIYNRIEDYGTKYQTTIENSIKTMSQIFDAYWRLECRNYTFERNVFNCYRAICRHEWSKDPLLWNNNETVSSIYAKIKDTFPIIFRLKYRLITTCLYRYFKNKRLI